MKGNIGQAPPMSEPEAEARHYGEMGLVCLSKILIADHQNSLAQSTNRTSQSWRRLSGFKKRPRLTRRGKALASAEELRVKAGIGDKNRVRLAESWAKGGVAQWA